MNDRHEQDHLRIIVRSSPQAPVAWAVCPGTTVGDLWIGANADGVIAVDWAWPPAIAAQAVTSSPEGGAGHPAHGQENGGMGTPIADPDDEMRRRAQGWADRAAAELAAYFTGKRQSFTVPVVVWGTAFQLEVWRALAEIPYGQTVSYLDIARRIGRPNAVRAVGQANRANRVPILIPCHRVIGKNGALVGYAGADTRRKALLLALEGANAAHA